MKINPRFLIAPNAFKESLSAREACIYIKKGLEQVYPESEYVLMPIADGGDGSFEVLSRQKDTRIISIHTKDPFHRDIVTEIAVSKEGYAVIEMARASGLHYLKEEEKDAMKADSFGTGIMIKKAMDEGCREILLGIGGTASMDGGTGILKALGYRFLDESGNDLPPGGYALKNLVKIIYPDYQEELKKTRIVILSDVDNPLLGENGAAVVFAPQKGANMEEVKQLENSLEIFTNIVNEQTGTEIGSIPFGGAAGGVPAGLKAFLNTEIIAGADKILDILEFDKQLQKCDIVITAEGKLDSQSRGGKAPVAAAKRAKSAGKAVIFIGGSVPALINECDYDLFTSAFTITPGPVGLDQSLENAAAWLERTAFNIGRVLKTGMLFSGRGAKGVP